jgi:hypothetical protein
VEIRFEVSLWQVEELHAISVFEDADGIRVILSHRWRDFWRVEHGALEKRGVELTLNLAFAPSLLIASRM